MECERRWGGDIAKWAVVHGSTLGSSLLTFILSLLVGARFLAESTIQDGNFLLTQANMRRHERDRVCTPCSRGSRVTGTLSSGVDCTRSG